MKLLLTSAFIFVEVMLTQLWLGKIFAVANSTILIWLKPSRWPIDAINLVYTGSGNGLLPNGTKQLAEPILTSH